MVPFRDAELMSALHLLFLALLVSDVNGIVCDFFSVNADTPPYTPYIPPTVSNQADIDRLFAGCTSITGDIIIAANYTGSFFLSNVTSISDGIGMQIYPDGSYPPVPSLTSIEVRDLTSISAMNIFNASNLTSISFSDLSTAQDIDIQALSGLTLNFPSLQNMSGFLQIAGNISSMNFPLLTTVNQTITAMSNPSAPQFYEGELAVDRTSYPPLDINFPALQNVGSVVISGNISSLSMPRFANTTTEIPPNENPEPGVAISTYGKPLNVDLPSLSNASYLRFAGTIGNISIPSLRSTTFFGLISTIPLNVSFAPLESVYQIDLSGNISALGMSTIHEVHLVSIESNLVLDCSPATSAWARTNHSASLSHDFISCWSLKPATKSIPLRINLGLGLGIPAAAIAFISVYLWWQKRRSPQRLKDSQAPPAYDLGGAPPMYSPTANGTSEQSLVGARSEDRSVNGAREEQVPTNSM